jgi:hypothetical protein
VGEAAPRKNRRAWDTLLALSGPDRTGLFAHCASLSLNAVHGNCNYTPGRAAHADQLARFVGLDLVAAGWTPTVGNYLGRVTKVRILEAVREAKGEASAQLIDHLKKPDMAKEAESRRFALRPDALGRQMRIRFRRSPLQSALPHQRRAKGLTALAPAGANRQGRRQARQGEKSRRARTARMLLRLMCATVR